MQNVVRVLFNISLNQTVLHVRHFIVPTLYIYAKMYWGVISDLCIHVGKNIILVIVILVFYIVVVHVLVSFIYLN